MFDLLFDPFSMGFMRRALAGCIALSLAGPPLGVFLVLRRMSLTTDVLQHGILPGIALGAVFGGMSLLAMGAGLLDRRRLEGRLPLAPLMVWIGAEALTRILDWNDRTTCVLFADGAGAVVLRAAEEPGVLTTIIAADGQYRDLLSYPFGVSSGFDRLRAGEPAALSMKGGEVFKVAVNKLSQLADQTLAKAGIDKSEIDWLVPHQANLRIIQAAARKLELPMEQVVVTVTHHGNTSAASVPLALDTAVRDGRIQRGQLLLLEAFGGGFTWGSALIRF